jgi:hypothetical protein
MSKFCEAAQKLVKLPGTVAINENLIAAQTRSKLLIQIDSMVTSVTGRNGMAERGG